MKKIFLLVVYSTSSMQSGKDADAKKQSPAKPAGDDAQGKLLPSSNKKTKF